MVWSEKGIIAAQKEGHMAGEQLQDAWKNLVKAKKELALHDENESKWVTSNSRKDSDELAHVRSWIWLGKGEEEVEQAIEEYKEKHVKQDYRIGVGLMEWQEVVSEILELKWWNEMKTPEAV